MHRAHNFMKKRKENQSPKEQAAAFRKAARALGCDESEEGFQDTLRKIAKRKPQRRSVKKKGAPSN